METLIRPNRLVKSVAEKRNWRIVDGAASANVEGNLYTQAVGDDEQAEVNTLVNLARIHA
jgi:hypothetical protein